MLTIGDLMNSNSSKYGEFLYRIVMVFPHNLEVDKTELARLIKISNNTLTFERKNGEKFTLDERDVEHLEIFKSPNYRGGL
jgi:hypothetical protein